MTDNTLNLGGSYGNLLWWNVHTDTHMHTPKWQISAPAACSHKKCWQRLSDAHVNQWNMAASAWTNTHRQNETHKHKGVFFFFLLFHCWWGPAAMLRFSAACCNKGQKQCTVVIKTNRWLIVFQRVWFSPTDHLSHLSSVELQGYNQHACETSARLNWQHVDLLTPLLHCRGNKKYIKLNQIFNERPLMCPHLSSISVWGSGASLTISSWLFLN